MFNYESHIIELNQKLVASGRQPLYIVYPTPGLGIADFPLSYINHGEAEKETVFLDLAFDIPMTWITALSLRVIDQLGYRNDDGVVQRRSYFCVCHGC